MDSDITFRKGPSTIADSLPFEAIRESPSKVARYNQILRILPANSTTPAAVIRGFTPDHDSPPTFLTQYLGN